MSSLLKIVCLYGFIAFGVRSDNTANPRIINGHSIEIENRPFMVSLHKKNHGLVCGGSIIHRHWVLTARHCIPEYVNARDYFFRAGSTYENEGGSIHWISNAVYFSNTETISENRVTHDILLVRVLHKFQLSKSIKLINLPDANSKAPHKLWVSGWGMMGEKSLLGHERKLQTVELDYITHRECVKQGPPSYRYDVSIKTHLCYYRHGRDACYRDSGGPLADHRTIYGVVSFGEGCAEFPGVYMKVTYYVHWINKVLKSTPKEN